MTSPADATESTHETEPTAYEQRHKDGSLWVRGQKLNGVAVGYWKWFRINGVKSRSGYFANGEQTGDWTTYDQTGAVYKVTRIKLTK